ncbi:hypothetical protein OsI_23705 [Oryza sativa Indica Group]|uniref:Uncharacterized protein n=1 Tax=Oryza sativa subsp. indica TaxID=39946 RepID=A2YF10_ORYSI|nr:hypothetical protein OsI_23705 [Oryza sativa Indica Group]
MEGMDPVACGAPDRSIRLHNGEGKEVVVVEEVDLAAATTMTTTTIMMMTLATITTTIAGPQQGSSGSASTLPLLDLAKGYEDGDGPTSASLRLDGGCRPIESTTRDCEATVCQKRSASPRKHKLPRADSQECALGGLTPLPSGSSRETVLVQSG